MKLDIGTGAFMPTKEARRAQIATRTKREREEVRDDGPDIRRALEKPGLPLSDFWSPVARLASLLAVNPALVQHAARYNYVRLPAKANDGKACSPRDRLSFFLEVGDVKKLPKTEDEHE